MIPTKEENPNGLHQRYRITKADGSPVDPRGAYFVLRLDGLGDDAGHVFACRMAAIAYADNAPDWMKQTADELRRLVAHFETGQV